MREIRRARADVRAGRKTGIIAEQERGIMPKQQKGQRDWRAAVRRWFKWWRNIDVLGWPAWIFFFLLLVYPGIRVARMLTYEQMSTRVATVSLGLVLAAITAAFIAWGLNSVVTRVAEYRKETVRRKNKNKRRK